MTPCPCPTRPRVLRRPQPLHRLPGVRAGVHRVRHAQGRVDDPPRVRRPRALGADRAGGLHALRAADLRRGLPGRRDQAHRGRRRADARASRAASPAATASGVSVRRAEDATIDRAIDDEVRHVLRPHVGRQASRCARRSARARRCSSARARRSRALRPQSMPTNQFQFGEQTITTRVNMMVPRDAPARRSST